MWRSYDPAVIDAELAVLAAHGLTMTRSFFYWPDFMPAPDRIDEAVTARFEDFLGRHASHGLTTIPTFIVGHMSGENWDPPLPAPCLRAELRPHRHGRRPERDAPGDARLQPRPRRDRLRPDPARRHRHRPHRAQLPGHPVPFQRPAIAPGHRPVPGPGVHLGPARRPGSRALTRESAGIEPGARLYLAPSVKQGLATTADTLEQLTRGGAAVYVSYSPGDVDWHRGPSYGG
jgi:hypothetical protein